MVLPRTARTAAHWRTSATQPALATGDLAFEREWDIQVATVGLTSRQPYPQHLLLASTPLGSSEAKTPETAVVSWLERLSRMVRSALITPQIAATAAGFPQGFPGDPADRLIYATAIENGWKLVSKDESLRSFLYPGVDVVW